MVWTDASVRERLKRSPNFNEFIDGKMPVLIDKIGNVTFLIFANTDETCDIYYQSPFNSQLDYSCVDSFFDVARPIINKWSSQRSKCKETMFNGTLTTRTI